jgi:hypothetical protein
MRSPEEAALRKLAKLDSALPAEASPPLTAL